MILYNFLNDYSEGAHENILSALKNSNLEQLAGYGEDKYCIDAAEKIKKEIQNPNAEIHFVSGGTQANLLCISAFLRPWESVIAAKTAHIEIHEAGAIEFTGHKISSIDGINGKLTPENIQYIVDFNYDEHMVFPKMVFISQTTELGTVYNRSELLAIKEACLKNNLYLYIDGARLGAAISSDKCDMNLADISNFADAFYIGDRKSVV